MLCRRGAGSPLGVVVAPVFPVLSLLFVGVGLPGLCAWAHCPSGGTLLLSGGASLLVCVLVLGVCPSLPGVLVLWLLFA